MTTNIKGIVKLTTSIVVHCSKRSRVKSSVFGGWGSFWKGSSINLQKVKYENNKYSFFCHLVEKQTVQQRIKKTVYSVFINAFSLWESSLITRAVNSVNSTGWNNYRYKLVFLIKYCTLNYIINLNFKRAKVSWTVSPFSMILGVTYFEVSFNTPWPILTACKSMTASVLLNDIFAFVCSADLLSSLNKKVKI